MFELMLFGRTFGKVVSLVNDYVYMHPHNPIIMGFGNIVITLYLM